MLVQKSTLSHQGSMRLKDRIEEDRNHGSSSPVTVATESSSISESTKESSKTVSSMLDVKDASSRKNRAASLRINGDGLNDTLGVASEHLPKTRSMSVVKGGDVKKKYMKLIKVRASDLSASTHGGAKADKSMDSKELEEVVKRWKAEKQQSETEGEDVSVFTTECRRVSRRPSMGGSNGRVGRASRRPSGCGNNIRRSVSRRRESIGGSRHAEIDDGEHVGHESAHAPLDPYGPRKERHTSSPQRESNRSRSRSQSRSRSRSKSCSRSTSRSRSKSRSRDTRRDGSKSPSESSRKTLLEADSSEENSDDDDIGFVVNNSTPSTYSDFQHQTATEAPPRGVLRRTSYQETDVKSPAKSIMRRGVNRSKSDDLHSFHNDICDEEGEQAVPISQKVLKTGIITQEQLTLLENAGFRITEA